MVGSEISENLNSDLYEHSCIQLFSWSLEEYSISELEQICEKLDVHLNIRRLDNGFIFMLSSPSMQICISARNLIAEKLYFKSKFYLDVIQKRSVELSVEVNPRDYIRLMKDVDLQNMGVIVQMSRQFEGSLQILSRQDDLQKCILQVHHVIENGKILSLESSSDHHINIINNYNVLEMLIQHQVIISLLQNDIIQIEVNDLNSNEVIKLLKSITLVEIVTSAVSSIQCHFNNIIDNPMSPKTKKINCEETNFDFSNPIISAIQNDTKETNNERLNKHNCHIAQLEKDKIVTSDNQLHLLNNETECEQYINECTQPTSNCESELNNNNRQYHQLSFLQMLNPMSLQNCFQEPNHYNNLNNQLQACNQIDIKNFDSIQPLFTTTNYKGNDQRFFYNEQQNGNVVMQPVNFYTPLMGHLPSILMDINECKNSLCNLNYAENIAKPETIVVHQNKNGSVQNYQQLVTSLKHSSNVENALQNNQPINLQCNIADENKEDQIISDSQDRKTIISLLQGPNRLLNKTDTNSNSDNCLSNYYDKTHEVQPQYSQTLLQNDDQLQQLDIQTPLNSQLHNGDKTQQQPSYGLREDIKYQSHVSIQQENQIQLQMMLRCRFNSRLKPYQANELQKLGKDLKLQLSLQIPNLLIVRGEKAIVESERLKIADLVEGVLKISTMEFDLAHSLHSRLIGVKGRVVQSLMTRFSVEIKFADRKSENPDLVRISGQLADIEMCKQCILDTLNMTIEEFEAYQAKRCLLKSIIARTKSKLENPAQIPMPPSILSQVVHKPMSPNNYQISSESQLNISPVTSLHNFQESQQIRVRTSSSSPTVSPAVLIEMGGQKYVTVLPGTIPMMAQSLQNVMMMPQNTCNVSNNDISEVKEGYNVNKNCECCSNKVNSDGVCNNYNLFGKFGNYDNTINRNADNMQQMSFNSQWNENQQNVLNIMQASPQRSLPSNQFNVQMVQQQQEYIQNSPIKNFNVPCVALLCSPQQMMQLSPHRISCTDQKINPQIALKQAMSKPPPIMPILQSASSEPKPQQPSFQEQSSQDHKILSQINNQNGSPQRQINSPNVLKYISMSPQTIHLSNVTPSQQINQLHIDQQISTNDSIFCNQLQPVTQLFENQQLVNQQTISHVQVGHQQVFTNCQIQIPQPFMQLNHQQKAAIHGSHNQNQAILKQQLFTSNNHNQPSSTIQLQHVNMPSTSSNTFLTLQQNKMDLNLNHINPNLHYVVLNQQHCLNGQNMGQFEPQLDAATSQYIQSSNTYSSCLIKSCASPDNCFQGSPQQCIVLNCKQ